MGERKYSVKVDEENRVVVISKKNVKYDIADMLDKRDDLRIYFSDIVAMPNKITVKAKCSPEDKFDREYGIALAKERFRNKYRANAIKAIDKAIAYLKGQMKILTEIRAKFED